MAKLMHLEEFEPHALFDGLGVGDLTGGGSAGPAPDGGQSFEKGYQAGWEDAATAAAQEQESFSAEFSHNLQDIGFTFHEARSHVVGSMESLLNALVETLLPEVLEKSIGARILEEIIPLAEEAANRPIQIVVSPENRKLVEPLLATKSSCPLELVEEPSLGSGQVFLRSGNLGKKIDLADATCKVKEAFDALLEDNRKVFAHG